MTDRLDYGSDVAGARDLLHQLAMEIAPTNSGWAVRIRQVCGIQLTQREVISRAPNNQQPLTEAIKDTMRRLHAVYPNMGHKEIGQLAGNFDGGRVSEVLNGLR